MRSKLAVLGFGCVAALGFLTATGTAQEGVVEKAGRSLDEVGRGIKRGVLDLSEGFRSRFEAVRADVNRMGIPNRVYSRIHWDKSLQSSRIEVHVLRDGSVLLRGTVPDTAAKERAVALARDTVDVTGVIDELTSLLPPEETPTPTPAHRRRAPRVEPPKQAEPEKQVETEKPIDLEKP